MSHHQYYCVSLVIICTLYRRFSAPTLNPVRFVSEETHVDLSIRTDLTPEVVYSVRVFAANIIGESNSSNEVMYARRQG